VSEVGQPLTIAQLTANLPAVIAEPRKRLVRVVIKSEVSLGRVRPVDGRGYSLRPEAWDRDLLDALRALDGPT
jgi:hypothetical protein